MTDLGTIGGQLSVPTAINEKGQVVGFTITPLGNLVTAFLWQDGKMTDLGTFGRGKTAGAVAINERGQVLVDRFPPGDSRVSAAFLWENGKTTSLGSLGGRITRARAINNLGQVVGDSYRRGRRKILPFVWQSGKMTALKTLAGPGPPSLPPVAINGLGQIVGLQYTAAGERAVMWTRRRVPG